MRRAARELLVDGTHAALFETTMTFAEGDALFEG